MKKIDWDKPLSEEDIAWLHTTGILGIEDRILQHQAKFNKDVEPVEIPPDPATRSAQDPSATRGEPVPGGVVTLVDPTAGAAVEPDDDYDTWSRADLDSEVDARNKLEGTSEVEVIGTGSNGGVTKADMVKGLRLWDQENPDALK